jgi:glucose-1-phosphate thymidylyltransferase
MTVSAFILAAGKGKRMFPFSRNIPKPMLPIINKPIIFHTIERFLQAGIHQIGIVVQKEDKIIPLRISEAFPDLDPIFIIQKESLGTAHAVLQIQEFVTTDNFLAIAGDSLFSPSFLEKLVSTHLNENNTITLSLEKMRFELMKYSSTVDYRNGRVWKVREKPQTKSEVLSDLNSAALYIFSKSIFSILPHLEKTERGEYELTTAINKTIQANKRVGGVETQRVCHISTPSDLWRYNLQFLSKKRLGKKEENLIGKKVKIAKSAKVENSVLGDNTVVISGVNLKNSVVLPNTTIKEDFENSLVQKDFYLKFESKETIE